MDLTSEPVQISVNLLMRYIKMHPTKKTSATKAVFFGVRRPDLLPIRRRKTPMRQKNTYLNQLRPQGGHTTNQSETITPPNSTQLIKSFFINGVFRFVI